jgi:uncharacterized oxidoreductase
MIVLTHGLLRAVAARILSAAGAAEADAATVADHLVDANLAGHDSHGVAMVPYYVRAIGAGVLDPRAHAAVEDGGGPALAVDGRSGFGQVVAREGIAAGIARARAGGVVAVALRDAFHVGRVGAYAEQAAAAGLASIHLVNVVGHAPFVAPFRGTDPRLSTNPFCVGVPGPDGRPALLLDFATSHVSYGKVRNAYAAGAPAPPGALIDARGRPTDDPSVMFVEPKGAMRPMGEYKGYGLALACELLAGALAGGGTLPRVPTADARITNNMVSILLDPARFPGGPSFAAEIAEGIRWVKASPPADPAQPVLVAGEPEAAARAARLAGGVPVPEAIWEEIRAAGRAVGAAEIEAG